MPQGYHLLVLKCVSQPMRKKNCLHCTYNSGEIRLSCSSTFTCVSELEMHEFSCYSHLYREKNWWQHQVSSQQVLCALSQSILVPRCSSAWERGYITILQTPITLQWFQSCWDLCVTPVQNVCIVPMGVTN